MSADVYLSVYCCKMFLASTDADKRACVAKGLILVPPADVDRVNDMSFYGRRRWGLAHVDDASGPDSVPPPPPRAP